MKKYTIMFCAFMIFQNNCYTKENNTQKGLKDLSSTTETMNQELTKTSNSLANLATNIKGIFGKFFDEDSKQQQSCENKINSIINYTNSTLQNIQNKRYNNLRDIKTDIAQLQAELNKISGSKQVNNTSTNNFNSNNQNTQRNNNNNWNLNQIKNNIRILNTNPNPNQNLWRSFSPKRND